VLRRAKVKVKRKGGRTVVMLSSKSILFMWVMWRRTAPAFWEMGDFQVVKES
jgi:hypothetical protein